MTTPTSPISVSLAEEIASELMARCLIFSDEKKSAVEIIQRRVEPLERVTSAAQAWKLCADLCENSSGADCEQRYNALGLATDQLLEALARLKEGR